MSKGEMVGYPSDVTDEEWEFLLPYLLLCREDSAQRRHDLRRLFNGVRYAARTGGQWRYLPHEYGSWWAVYQQMRLWLDRGDREQVAALAEELQQVTGSTVELAYVDQGYTGLNAAEAASEHGIRLEVVKHPMAKRGFVLLPRRWVVERSFAWAARFRRLARDYQRLNTTLKGFHYIAFTILITNKLINAALTST